jgi:hypothetical protein
MNRLGCSGSDRASAVGHLSQLATQPADFDEFPYGRWDSIAHNSQGVDADAELIQAVKNS